MGFSRQENWNGLPCPPPGDLPYPRIEPGSLTPSALAGGFFTTSAIWKTEIESESHSIVSDCLRPRGLYSPWNSPGQNTGVGSLSLLQGIVPTQGLNPGLPHCRWIIYCLSHQGSPVYVHSGRKRANLWYKWKKTGVLKIFGWLKLDSRQYFLYNCLYNKFKNR